jgi:transcriptional regulator with XRE-family HTH domain
VADTCLAVLTAAFRTFSAKELARAGGISVETAKRYRTGLTTPDVLTLTRLMRQSRAIADAVLRLAGLDDLSLDIEQGRLVRALADIEQQRLAAHEALDRAFPPRRPDPRTARAAAGGTSGQADAPPRRAGEAS